MEYYNKVIESVGVRFAKGNNYKIERPVTITDYTDVENTVILLHHGSLSYEEGQESVNEGEILFIPAGRSCKLSFGTVSKRNESNNENFVENKKKFLQTISFKDIKNSEEDCVTILTFEAKVFDVVNFFQSLCLPPLVVPINQRGTSSNADCVKELKPNIKRNERGIKIHIETLDVEIVRHIVKNRLFVKEQSTNSTYIKEPRFIDM